MVMGPSLCRNFRRPTSASSRRWMLIKMAALRRRRCKRLCKEPGDQLRRSRARRRPANRRNRGSILPPANRLKLVASDCWCYPHGRAAACPPATHPRKHLWPRRVDRAEPFVCCVLLLEAVSNVADRADTGAATCEHGVASERSVHLLVERVEQVMPRHFFHLSFG